MNYCKMGLVLIVLIAFVCGGQDVEVLKLSDAVQKGCVRILSGHSGVVDPVVYSIAFSPDGEVIATGSRDKTVKLWRTSTGELLATLSTKESDEIYAVAFSPDGTILASTGLDGKVRLWDVARGNLIRTLTIGRVALYALAFSSSGELLAVAGQGPITLWDYKEGNLVFKVPLDAFSIVSDIAFRPDEKELLASCLRADEQVADLLRIDLERRTARFELLGYVKEDGEIETIAVVSPPFDTSPDTFYLALGDDANQVSLLLQCPTCEFPGLAWFEKVHHDSWVMEVAFRADGKLLASGSRDRTIKLWRTPPLALLGILSLNDEVFSLAFGPHEDLLASGDADGMVLLWDMEKILPKNQAPVADFVWEAVDEPSGRVAVIRRPAIRILFDASASHDLDGEIVTFAWDWEANGSFDETTTEAIFEHQFDTSGSHSVTLQVTDNDGGTNEVTKTIVVEERVPPRGAFAFSPSRPSLLDDVLFTDKSSEEDGQIESWGWAFGDGEISTDRHPTHRYKAKGEFVVTLTVTDNDGLSDTVSQQLTVVNLVPEALFTFAPENPCAGQSVRFDASSSNDRDGEIRFYEWDFDEDGDLDAEGVTANWSFPRGEEYTVSLTVTDNNGATSVCGKEITVVSGPPGPPRFEDQWAIVIGVGEYEDPGLTDLVLPKQDAEAFYQFLVSAQGGGFPVDHVQLLVNEDASRQAIHRAFGWVVNRAAKGDLVLVYFSGHGGHEYDHNGDEPTGDTEDEYLLPYDTDSEDLFSSAIRDDEVADWIGSTASEHVLLVFDSCFSGGAARLGKSYGRAGARAGPGNTVFTDLTGEDVLVMAACQDTEYAQQDEDLGYGVFTYFMLKGLGGLGDRPEADDDSDGRVTVEELREYLAREVPTHVHDVMYLASPQNPMISGDETLIRVALSGYGEPLVGEVTAVEGDTVMISLGSRHGVRAGDRFKVVHALELPDGQAMQERRAIIEVLYLLGPDRSACYVIDLFFPIELMDSVEPLR